MNSHGYSRARVTGVAPSGDVPMHSKSLGIPLTGAVAIFLALGALVALETQSEDLALRLSATTAILVLGMIFAADYRESKNALSPICISCIYLFLMFPFHGLMMHDDLQTIVRIGADVDIWFSRGLLVFSVVIPFLYLGYRSKFSARLARLLPSPRFEVDDTHPTTTRKLLIIFFVAWLARAIAYNAGLAFHWDGAEKSLKDIQFVLAILINLPVFVTAWFLSVGARDKNRVLFILGASMLIGEFAWGLVSGSRLRMLLPIAAAVAAMSYLGRPMGLRRMVVILAVFALVVFPFTTAFRQAYFGRLTSVQRDGVEASTIVDSLTEAANENDDTSDAEGPFEVLAERLHGLTSFSLIMRYTPERHDYFFGVPLLIIPLQILVPRAIWPEKPEVSPFAPIFHEYYWGLERGSNTSIAMTQIGDLWVNLHIFGAIAGTYFFGAILALIFRRLRYGIVTRSVFPSLVFAVHLPQLLQGFEVSFDFTMTALPKSLLVYFIVAWILARRRAPPQTGANTVLTP